MRRLKTKVAALALTQALTGVLCAASAEAVEFKAQGEWLWGFGGVESSMSKDRNGGKDVFDARQRLRMELEATVSESLSGVIGIQIGDIAWGKAEDGGALGADGKIVRLRSAYIDWQVPNTELKLRMGLQGVALPNAAGGSSILDEQTMAVVGSWKINDSVGLSAFWLRPFNDNYTGASTASRQGREDVAGFLDNADYVGLSLPLTFPGVEITPWAMLGFVGRNAVAPVDTNGDAVDGPLLDHNMPLSFTQGQVQDGSFNHKGTPYATQFYAGLPIKITALEPWNFELDLNYGYSSGWGSYAVLDRLGMEKRADSLRQGWLAKGLVEYKLDWGTPGFMAWYASGDDGDAGNGSERMPAIAPSSNFTSFMQDGETGWSVDGGYDLMLSYAGTWGLGLQLKDLSFLDNLSHTLRVAYWGGTNSPEMIKQTTSQRSFRLDNGIYLTTNDHLVEFNIDSTWKIYENLEAVLELGYIINGIDQSAWRRHSSEASLETADAWKAALIMKYTF